MNWLKRFFAQTNIYPADPPHVHTWTKWREYGWSYQERNCTECGFIQNIDKGGKHS